MINSIFICNENDALASSKKTTSQNGAVATVVPLADSSSFSDLRNWIVVSGNFITLFGNVFAMINFRE